MRNNEEQKRYLSEEYEISLKRFEKSKDDPKSHIELIKDMYTLYEHIFREIIRSVISSGEDTQAREILVKYESKHASFTKMGYGQCLGLLKKSNSNVKDEDWQGQNFYEKFVKILDSKSANSSKTSRTRLEDGFKFAENMEFSEVRKASVHAKGSNDPDNILKDTELIKYLSNKSTEGLRNFYYGIFEKEIDSSVRVFEDNVEQIEEGFLWLNNKGYISAEELKHLTDITKGCKDKPIHHEPIITLLGLLSDMINRLSTGLLDKQPNTQPLSSGQKNTKTFNPKSGSDANKTSSVYATNAVQTSKVLETEEIETKNYTEANHLNGASERMKRLYWAFKDGILNIDENIAMKTTKLYIAFRKGKKDITDIRVSSSSVKIWINLKRGGLDDPKGLTRDVSAIGHWGNGDYEIKMDDDGNLDYIFSLIKQAYEKLS